jgi:aldose 1-epimerase
VTAVESATHRTEKIEVAGFLAYVLHDDAADMHTTWVPGAGMLGASLMCDGMEFLWQGAGVEAYARERKFMGIPFLYPWANRLDGYRYTAGGHEVTLDPGSPLLKLDPNRLPIHGLLTASPLWSVEDTSSVTDVARLAASLEFNTPDLLSAFPFPHRVEMEIRLGDGAVQVTTTVAATGPDPVPVAFGFHPYFQLPGIPRSDWEVSFPVRRRLVVDDRLIPTGDAEPVEPISGPIYDRTWDDGFDRIDTPAEFVTRGGRRTNRVEFGSGYPVAQVFAPPGEEYVCIEPMTARTNALCGPDGDLTWVRPGQQWSAAFRILVATET